MTPTKKWFGKHFTALHPLIQELHTHGGSLTGDVNIKFGAGVAGLVGKRLAKKLEIPSTEGIHSLKVVIKHTDDKLHWSRCFDNTQVLNSVFTPVRNKSNGYWEEKTGAIELYLKVDIKNQGWYWKPIKTKIKGIPLPMWLLPKTTAYKYIESDKYKFYVGFSFFTLGTFLSYSGLLTPHVKGKSDNVI
jgi:hypothetical protein